MRTEPTPSVFKRLALASGGAFLVVLACTLPGGDFSGKACSTQTDCPQPYACIGVQPGALKTCELLETPEIFDAGPEFLDGGNVFYCSPVKGLLDTYCVSCHGPTQQNGGNFRLDSYDPVGPIPGARAFAGRIKVRAYDTASMPPPTAPVLPTHAERRELAIWTVSGAPFCGPDGGTAGGDGGTAGTDGGTSDAGL